MLTRYFLPHDVVKTTRLSQIKMLYLSNYWVDCAHMYRERQQGRDVCMRRMPLYPLTPNPDRLAKCSMGGNATTTANNVSICSATGCNQPVDNSALDPYYQCPYWGWISLLYVVVGSYQMHRCVKGFGELQSLKGATVLGTYLYFINKWHSRLGGEFYDSRATKGERVHKAFWPMRVGSR